MAAPKKTTGNEIKAAMAAVFSKNRFPLTTCMDELIRRKYRNHPQVIPEMISASTSLIGYPLNAGIERMTNKISFNFQCMVS
jgi:hypothetical protein